MTSSISRRTSSGVRVGEVDLVDDRDHLEVIVERLVDVGERLRLDALGGIDDQQRALARGERSRHLVGEVDVARGVDEIQLVGDAVGRPCTRVAPPAP